MIVGMFSVLDRLVLLPMAAQTQTAVPKLKPKLKLKLKLKLAPLKAAEVCWWLQDILNDANQHDDIDWLTSAKRVAAN